MLARLADTGEEDLPGVAVVIGDGGADLDAGWGLLDRRGDSRSGML
jgi:hypothetical protein